MERSGSIAVVHITIGYSLGMRVKRDFIVIIYCVDLRVAVTGLDAELKYYLKCLIAGLNSEPTFYSVGSTV